MCQNTPQQIPTINGADDIIGVSCGYSHTVLVKSDGTVWSFGSNYSGQLGLGNNTNQNTPQQIPTINSVDNIIGVSCGASYTVLVKNDGTAWSFGRNDSGQLGLGNDTDQHTPQQIPTINSVDNIIGVSCGDYHTVLVKSDGTAWSFGRNDSGQLGLGNNTSQNTPQQIPTINDIIGVSCGGNHTVLVKSDGTAWSFGLNVYGQLGLGNNTNYNTPQQIPTINDIDDIIGVSCGNFHTVLIKSDGTVWSFGNNVDGQLGLGNSAPLNQNTPQQIPDFNLNSGRLIKSAAKRGGNIFNMLIGSQTGGMSQKQSFVSKETESLCFKVRPSLLKEGGKNNNEYYRRKYLKYKQKYIQLKNH